MRGLIRDRLRAGTHDLACEALLHSTSLLAHNIYNTHCRSDNFIMYKFWVCYGTLKVPIGSTLLDLWVGSGAYKVYTAQRHTWSRYGLWAFGTQRNCWGLWGPPKPQQFRCVLCGSGGCIKICHIVLTLHCCLINSMPIASYRSSAEWLDWSIMILLKPEILYQIPTFLRLWSSVFPISIIYTRPRQILIARAFDNNRAHSLNGTKAQGNIIQTQRSWCGSISK